MPGLANISFACCPNVIVKPVTAPRAISLIALFLLIVAISSLRPALYMPVFLWRLKRSLVHDAYDHRDHYLYLWHDKKTQQHDVVSMLAFSCLLVLAFLILFSIRLFLLIIILNDLF